MLTYVVGRVEQAPEIAIAHCVSADFHLGRGVARDIRRKYGNRLRNQLRAVYPDVEIGDCIETSHGSRRIFHMVTKRWFHNRPTYQAMEDAILSLRGQLFVHGISQLAIPKIGCGLDRLNWDIVAGLLDKYCTSVDIRVYIPPQ